MALYHKWDVKNDFAYELQFFSLISDSLGSVGESKLPTARKADMKNVNLFKSSLHQGNKRPLS